MRKPKQQQTEQSSIEHLLLNLLTGRNTQSYKKGGVDTRKKILITAIALCLISTYVLVANATYGYWCTSNYHGQPVPPNTLVTVTASTDDTTITRVTFIWRDGSGSEQHRDSDVPIVNGACSSTFAPNTIGDWSCQAHFQDGDGITRTIHFVSNVVEIRATSFNVVPELPIIGTVGALSMMLAGFTYKMKRKPHN